jgi:hypothetical protein
VAEPRRATTWNRRCTSSLARRHGARGEENAMNERVTGFLCGALGGIAGLAAMKLAMDGTKRFVRQRAPRPRDVFASERSMSLVGVHHQEGESATQALARVAHERLTGRAPSAERKQTLGQAVHVGYGLLMAALYGLARARQHGLDLRAGALYGTGMWALGDELAVPLLGLADKPTRYHPTYHLQALAGHLAFGLATAAAAQAALHLAVRRGEK